MVDMLLSQPSSPVTCSVSVPCGWQVCAVQIPTVKIFSGYEDSITYHVFVFPWQWYITIYGVIDGCEAIVKDSEEEVERNGELEIDDDRRQW